MGEERKLDLSRYVKKIGGRDYLVVAGRVLACLEDHPAPRIETEIVHLDINEKVAVFKATVTLENGAVGVGHSLETFERLQRKNGPLDWLECAETSAIGRALGLLGYGTECAFDEGASEGTRVVDTPRPPAETKAAAPAKPVPAIKVADKPAEQAPTPLHPITEQQFVAIAKLAQKLKWADGDVIELARARGLGQPTIVRDLSMQGASQVIDLLGKELNKQKG